MGLYIGYDPIDLNISQNKLHFNYYIKPPMFAMNNTWYRGTTDISTIREINIVDSHTPTGNETETYNADVNNEGSIKCYVNDTVLTIAGNGSSKIMCNPESLDMFRNFTNLKSINGLQLLDTSNVTRMDAMFEFDSSLTTLDLSNFNTSKVTYMSNMFSDCSNLTTLDVSSFDTSKVCDMEYMFNNCRSLTSLDLSSFDTSKVETMLQMFSRCGSLTSLDLSSFDTSKAYNMTAMFNLCSNLTTIYTSELWSTDACTESTIMFNQCVNLVGDIAYNSNYKDKTYATTTGGYLTYKSAPTK